MPEVHLHLGAHKTATTSIQDVLNEFRPSMAEVGLFYLPLARSRISISGPLTTLSLPEKKGLRLLVSRRSTHKELASYLEQLTAGSADILISDENLLGPPGDSMSGQFYPNAAARLQRLADLLPAPVTRVFLSVRDYGSFFSALYTEALRWGSHVRPEALVLGYAHAERHWSALVQTIGAVFPAAQISLWRYEDFRAVRAEVLAAMARLPVAVIGASPNRTVRPGISKAGVVALLQTFETLEGTINRQCAALAAQAAYPRTFRDDRYDPWPDILRDEMSAIYAQEWAQWQDDPQITLLIPGAPNVGPAA